MSTGPPTTDLQDATREAFSSRRPEDALVEAVSRGVDHHAVVALDPEGHIVTWNKGAERLTNYDQDDAVGHHVSILYPEDAILRGEPRYDLVATEENGAFETEGWRRRKDGSIFRANHALSAIRRDDGTLEGFSLVLTDVTRQRNREEALREEATLFRLMAHQVQDYVILAIDPEGRIRSWNEGGRVIKGYTQEEILGKHVSIFYPQEAIHAGRPEEDLRLAALHGRHAEEGWRVRRDGSRFWAGVLVTALHDSQGRLVGYSKVARDLTAQRQAATALRAREQQQAAAAQLGVDALRGVDLQELFEKAVNAVTDTLQIEYAKVLRLLPGGDRMRLEAGVGWQEGAVGHATVPTDLGSQAGFTMASKEPVIVEDLRTETRFHGPRLLFAHGVVSGMSVTIGPHGNPWGVFGAHTTSRRTFTDDDIHFLQNIANILANAILRQSGEDELEQRVEERTQDLLRTNRELEAFNAMVAHDLRAPARALAHVSRVAKEEAEGLDAPELTEMLESLSASGERIASLVEALLTFNGITTGDVVRRDVDLTAMAREAFREAWEGEAPEHKVDVTIEEGMHARADPRLTRVLLDNLVANAIKFTRDAESPSIRVGVADPSGPVFEVRDNGAGFPSEEAGSLFTAFRRLHTRTEFPGTGIGLATAQRIIERHGGRIWAESAGRGRGATIYFTLGQPGGAPPPAPRSDA